MKDAQYMKALGRAIRDVRKSRGLTISDLHYECRIARQAVGEIEQGKVMPQLGSILRICQALEVKPSTLFAMADTDKP
jgi:transcriptional regulator with XRE-family HTH domain